jgi:hypothetical protein
MAHGDDFDIAGDGDLQGIYWRDEILQLMYWLKGEGLSEDVHADDLRRFLDAAPRHLEEQLLRLVQGGYLEPIPGASMRYRLSALGVEEGRRRFEDEFAPYLGRESHGECGDAACECHTAGEACTRLQGRERAC